MAAPTLRLTVLAALALAGCHAPETTGLQRLDPDARGPDLVTAWESGRASALAAAARSLDWFRRDGSRASFPWSEPHLTHERARASVTTMAGLLRTAPDGRTFAEEVRRLFDVYEATGRDGDGRVFFTGYFAPEYPASREPDERYRHPLYTRPPGDAGTGLPRHAIEDGDLLAGRELAWLADPLDAYLVHVNGSGRLRLPDGAAMHVGHAGTNELPYTSLGRLLIDAGLATEEEMSMQVIRSIYERTPETVRSLMRRNDRYVYFREIAADAWPQGVLGVPLTAEASVATDRAVFPPGGIVLVETVVGAEAFVRFAADQDTGGAIKGPGRADIYMGAGQEAGAIAGRQKSYGRLYYFLLKPPARATGHGSTGP